MTDEIASSNGQVDGLDEQDKPSTDPLTERYQHSIDWRDSVPITTSFSETLDLKEEEIEVQAAIRVLEGKNTSLYLDWTIHHPDRLLAAAREMARIHRDIERVLTSNDFRPA